jgi:hypothetical protein
MFVSDHGHESTIYTTIFHHRDILWFILASQFYLVTNYHTLIGVDQFACYSAVPLFGQLQGP